MAPPRWPEASMAPASERRAGGIAFGRGARQVGKGAGGSLGIGDALGGDEDVGDPLAFLLIVALPQLPAADGGEQQHEGRDGVAAIGLPQLLEPLAANVFLDFAENITHGAFL